METVGEWRMNWRPSFFLNQLIFDSVYFRLHNLIDSWGQVYNQICTIRSTSGLFHQIYHQVYTIRFVPSGLGESEPRCKTGKVRQRYRVQQVSSLVQMEAMGHTTSWQDQEDKTGKEQEVHKQTSLAPGANRYIYLLFLVDICFQFGSKHVKVQDVF